MSDQINEKQKAGFKALNDAYVRGKQNVVKQARAFKGMESTQMKIELSKRGIPIHASEAFGAFNAGNTSEDELFERWFDAMLPGQ